MSPGSNDSPLETLRQLREMLDAGTLTPVEFEVLKQQLVFGPVPAVPPAAPAPPVAALRSLTQNFASAARLKAYRDLIAEAEKKLKEAEKEKEKLEKSTAEARRSTTNNLTRMEEMRKQNLSNRQQITSDSVALGKNIVVRQAAQLRLQRRRDRLTALDRKN